MHCTGLASRLYLYTIVAGKASITMLMCWECNVHFYVIKKQLSLLNYCARRFLFICLFNYVFFFYLFLSREGHGSKRSQYKIFIEHPTYLSNQRQKKKCSKLQCKF